MSAYIDIIDKLSPAEKQEKNIKFYKENGYFHNGEYSYKAHTAITIKPETKTSSIWSCFCSRHR